MNIEDTTITRKKNQFLVQNIEDVVVSVQAKYVSEILAKVSAIEENEVVVLLAIIELSKRVEPNTTSKKIERLDYAAAISAIIELLGYYSMDNLISIFEDMKYSHIKYVLESDNPVRKLEMYR